MKKLIRPGNRRERAGERHTREGAGGEPALGTGVLLLLGALAMVSPAAAQAYIGPGAGFTAIGSAIALVGVILLGIVGFIWYPLRRLFRRRGRAKSQDDKAGSGRHSGDGDQPQKRPIPRGGSKSAT